MNLYRRILSVAVIAGCATLSAGAGA